MLCKGGVLFASDSQTTINGLYKSQDANKIRLMGVAGCSVMIAQAGDQDRSRRAIELIEQLGQGAKIKDYRSIAELAERAVLQLRHEIRKQRMDCSADELEQYLQRPDEDSLLMIAYLHAGRSYIFQISLSRGAANLMIEPQGRHFAVMGTGSELALYLMREFSQRGMSLDAGTATLIYAVGEVMKHDLFCSGAIRCSVLTDNNCACMVDDPVVAETSKHIETYNRDSAEERNRKITEMLAQATANWFEKVEKEAHGPVAGQQST